MNSRRRTRVLLLLLVLTSFTLLTLDYNTNTDSPLRPLESAVGKVVGPVQRAVGGFVGDLSEGVHFGDQDARIAELQARNDELTRQLLVVEQDQRELAQLKDLVGLTDRYEILPARIIGRGTAVDEWSLLIDLGTADGISEQTTVVTGVGLLGKVVEVQERSAKVRLVNDRRLQVAVAVTRTGQRGFLRGDGTRPMRLQMLDPEARLREGDVVVTAGSPDNQPFYPGLPVGRVTRIVASPGSAYQTALVSPFADATSLEYVGVVVDEGPKPPRRPLPTPSEDGTTSAPAREPDADGGAVDGADGAGDGEPGGTADDAADAG